MWGKLSRLRIASVLHGIISGSTGNERESIFAVRLCCSSTQAKPLHQSHLWPSVIHPDSDRCSIPSLRNEFRSCRKSSAENLSAPNDRWRRHFSMHTTTSVEWMGFRNRIASRQMKRYFYVYRTMSVVPWGRHRSQQRNLH